jgi:hypothetical protein
MPSGYSESSAGRFGYLSSLRSHNPRSARGVSGAADGNGCILCMTDAGTTLRGPAGAAVARKRSDELVGAGDCEE